MNGIILLHNAFYAHIELPNGKEKQPTLKYKGWKKEVRLKGP